MRVLVSDKIAKEGIDILKSELKVDVRTDLTPDQLREIIKDYDALVVRSQTKVTKDLIECSNLKVIGRAGVGVDNIDVEAATLKGILVVNAPEGNTIAACEHTFALMFAVARKIPQAVSSLKSGRWERNKFTGVQLSGKTLGVIGLGRIGKEVAKRASSLGMNVVGYDPYIARENVENLNIKLTDLDEVLRTSDFITFHVPLTKATRRMIGEEQFKIMKDGVYIINCARGGIIDEKALYDALVSGKVAGCALDVFEKEPPEDNPLLSLDNVIATPHLGASTAEAQIVVAEEVAKDIIRALKGEIVKNPVNMVSVRPEEYSFILPYIRLAEKMGCLYTQLKNGRIQEVEMIYGGRLANMDVKLVTTAGIKGLLSNILQVPANLINAPIIARDRGIKITEKKIKEDEDAPGTVTMRVTTDKEVGTISGCVFEKDSPRITGIDDYKIDLIPEGYVLITNHKDKPGIVGKVGTILGKNDINIASMQLGRKSYRGDALMALSVDEEIPESVLKEIKAIEDLKDAVFVKL
ncbi:D-3-phosphoglycerate dehydrogenase [Fervidicola ferrireducens]|uniref:D-3-phosphoglycerate dehydrogenase n=1 Tax=Fervidicola ferrireducens TaxID=520764 RepID=A0A140LBV0_9FIRM|nr:phosphoglycerate dehydrogenase [Fervidicola ferrireducens]KXG78025.1 D-3-phosphoglycerate dehydrogenase [Fervidicola ferrireducens]